MTKHFHICILAAAISMMSTAGAAPQITLLGSNPITMEAGGAFSDPAAIGTGGAVTLSGGGVHTLAVKRDGTVAAWGGNANGQTDIPSDLHEAVAVAAGEHHSLALKSDGTVVAWGYDGHDQATAPSGLSGVIAVAAGYLHSLALKSDGTVAAWGSSFHGESSVPAGLGNVVAIAAGGYSSLALKNDGTVAAWGHNAYGQTDVPAGLGNVVAIAAGSYHHLALKSDGTVTAWGHNVYGQTDVPADLSNVVAIAAGDFHSIALKSDGTVVAWGSNSSGQATVPSGLNHIVAITAGLAHNVAISADGTFTVWGASGSGQSNVPPGLEVSLAGTVRTWRQVNANVPGTYLLIYTVLDGLGSEGRAIRTVNVVDTTPPTATLNGDSTITVEAGAFVDPGITGIDNAPAVRAAAGGSTHSLALKSDGTVAAWGSNHYRQTNLPAGLGNVVGIAAGDVHSLALKGDGTVAAWGSNFDGQTTVPAGLDNVTSIAVGFLHNLALKSDGTVVAWGSNDLGQSDIPLGLTNVVAIAAGAGHSLALKSDGTVVAWGSNDLGQLDVPSDLTDAVAIAAGGSINLALRRNGTLTSWGRDYSNSPISTVPDGLTDVLAIAVGGYHFRLALKSNGTVIAWGNDAYGGPNVPANLTDVVAIAAGKDHSLAVKSDGIVVAWGHNSSGQIDVPAGLSDRTTTAITGSMDIHAVGSYTLTYKAVDLAGNESAPLTRTVNVVDTTPPSLDTSNVPLLTYMGDQLLPDLTGYIVATDNATGSVAVIQSPKPGAVLQEGTFTVTFTGTDASNNSIEASVELTVGPKPIKVTLLGSNPLTVEAGDTFIEPGAIGTGGAVPIAAGHSHNLVLKDDGTVAAWGRNLSGQTDVPAGLSDVVTVAAGEHHSLALKADGTIMAWGFNEFGQSNVPAAATDVVALAAGGHHSVALRRNGTALAWGRNQSGQCSVPTGLHNVVAVAAGFEHNLALKSDGTVIAWGGNSAGQTNVPAGLSGVVAIAAGYAHSLALKGDGTVTAWGSSLGSPPAGLSNVVAIATRKDHSLALKGDGTAVAWGDDSFGQATVPVGLKNVVAISAGNVQSLALKSDGTVIAWGDDSEGAGSVPPGLEANLAGTVRTWGRVNAAIPGTYFLTYTLLNGRGSEGRITRTVHVVDTTPPTAVLRGANPFNLTVGDVFVDPGATATDNAAAVSAIAAGNNHSLALKSDGTVIAWGSNTYGQTSIPTGLTNVTAIAACGNFSIALKSDGTVVAWGYHVDGQINVAMDLFDVMAIAAGHTHSLALKRNGAVIAWGSNSDGQSTVPAELANVVAIAGGGSHSLALKSDGTVTAWGSNSVGQSSVLSGLNNVVAIAAGNGHSLALKSDGTVTAWGGNSVGQSSVPSGLSNVVAIAAGNGHSLALDSNGNVIAWGDNNEGQSSVPGGLSNVVAIAAGNGHSLALDSNGNLVGWGANFGGQTTVPAGLSDRTTSTVSGTVDATTLGTYTLTYKAIDMSGNESAPVTRTVNVNGTPPPVGTYSGLVDGAGFADSGSLTATMSAANRVTGRLTYGGKTYSFRGILDANGAGVFSLKRSGGLPPLELTLQGAMVDGANGFLGTVFDGTNTSDIISRAALYHAQANPFPDAGAYTMRLGPFDSGPTLPRGNGSASVTFSTAGLGRAIGTLGDGTKFIFSGPVTHGDIWPLHVLLYGNQGDFAAFITFTHTDHPTAPDLLGEIDQSVWSKPARPKDAYYPLGFTLRTEIFGVRYTPPAFPQRVINVLNVAGNAEIAFVEGDLDTTPSSPLRHQLTIDSAQKVTALVPTADKLKLTINAKTGLITGSFVHPVSLKSVKLAGVAYQKEPHGTGMFFGIDQTGPFGLLASDIGAGIAPGDGTKNLPKVAITSPRNKAKFSPDTVAVPITGTAKAKTNGSTIAKVQYQVLAPDGTISDVFDASGTDNWVFTLTLLDGPGTYTVFVKAIETGTDNESSLYSRSFTLLELPAPF